MTGNFCGDFWLKINAKPKTGYIIHRPIYILHCYIVNYSKKLTPLRNKWIVGLRLSEKMYQQYFILEKPNNILLAVGQHRNAQIHHNMIIGINIDRGIFQLFN